MSRPAPSDVATSTRMRAVRRRGTLPEMRVRTALRTLGIAYRLDSRLPGRPDVTVTGRNVVIFVHGCFWHRHQRCPRTTSPRLNEASWAEKFRSNVRRDERVRQQLEHRGYTVITLWECETTDPAALHARLTRELMPAAKGRFGCAVHAQKTVVPDSQAKCDPRRRAGPRSPGR
jgi:DNA mismatch endonuclease, patch repair protein